MLRIQALGIHTDMLSYMEFYVLSYIVTMSIDQFECSLAMVGLRTRTIKVELL